MSNYQGQNENEKSYRHAKIPNMFNHLWSCYKRKAKKKIRAGKRWINKINLKYSFYNKRWSKQ